MRGAAAGLLACLVLAAPAAAQAPALAAEHMTLAERNRADGMAHHSAFHLVQDHQGFLWIGTNDGLSRYDGHSFRTFRHDPADSASLSNNTVRRVFEDSQHRLWVRTESALDRLDRASGRLHHYPMQPQVILEDSEGALLVAAHEGVFRYEPGRDAFEMLWAFPLAGHPESPSPADPVWGILSVATGGLWVSTQKGHLFWLDARGGLHHRKLPWVNVMLLRLDDAGRLWVGHANGLALVDTTTRRPVPHPPFAGVQGAVFAIEPHDDSTIWLGGDRLYRTDRAGRRVTAIDIGRDALPNPIWSILRDREGITWLGTSRGLRFHDPYAKRWEHLPAATGDPEDLAGQAVMALALAGDRELWVGSLDAGLEIAEGDWRPGSRGVRSGAGPRSPCTRGVWAVLPPVRGRAWVGTDQGLCQVVDGRSAPVALGRGSAEPEPVVFALARDPSGAIWAGTTQGLYRVDAQTRRVRRIPGVTDERDGRVSIQGLLVDGNGVLWAGTSRSDVYRIQSADGPTTHFPVGDRPGLRGSEGFWALAEVGDGRLWLGSDRGLHLFDPASGSLEPVGAQSGMPAVPVYGILQDEQGALWLSTNNGLLRHDNPLTATRASALVRHYTAADGLPLVEFNRRAATAGPDGWLLFGGMGGVVRFHPGEFRDNPHPPPVRVDGVERINALGSRHLPAPESDTLTLAADDTGLVLALAAPSFTDPHRVRVSYMLEGVDADWILAGAERLARYPALPPGRYHFKIRAANADGVWNLEGASLTIVVPPFWWATTWFRLLVGVALGAALVAPVRWLTTRPLRRRLRMLELDQRVRGERERISRDLHDHVGAQVSTLLAGIELAGLHATRGAMDTVQSDLNALHADARRTMTQLRETVWSLQHERSSLRDLVGQIQEHLEDRQRYRQRPVLECTHTGGLSRELPSGTALHLFRMVQEAVSNAIRHAGASQVQVGVTESPGGLRVVIGDDGAFQPPSSAHQGTGLAGMRARALEIGATLDIRHGRGGTVVEIVLPSGTHGRQAGPRE